MDPVLRTFGPLKTTKSKKESHHYHIVVNPIELPAFPFHSFERKAQALVKCNGRFVRGVNIKFYPLQADSLCVCNRFLSKAPPGPLTSIFGQHTHAKASNVGKAFPLVWKDVAPADHLLAFESNELRNPARDRGPDEFADRSRWGRLGQRQVSPLPCHRIETHTEAFDVRFRHRHNANVFAKPFHLSFLSDKVWSKSICCDSEEEETSVMDYEVRISESVSSTRKEIY